MEDEKENNGRASRRCSRRSSILKDSPSRVPLEDVKSTMQRRRAKRVSFADTNTIKEFLATMGASTEWNSTYETPAAQDSSNSMELTGVLDKSVRTESKPVVEDAKQKEAPVTTNKEKERGINDDDDDASHASAFLNSFFGLPSSQPTTVPAESPSSLHGLLSSQPTTVLPAKSPSSPDEDSEDEVTGSSNFLATLLGLQPSASAHNVISDQTEQMGATGLGTKYPDSVVRKLPKSETKPKLSTKKEAFCTDGEVTDLAQHDVTLHKDIDMEMTCSAGQVARLAESKMTHQLGTDMKMTCPAGQVAEIAQSEMTQQLGTDMEMTCPAGQVAKIAQSEMTQQLGTDMEMTCPAGGIGKIAQSEVTQQLGTDMEMTFPADRVGKIAQSEVTQQLGTDMEMTCPADRVGKIAQSEVTQQLGTDMEMTCPADRVAKITQSEVAQQLGTDMDMTCPSGRVAKIAQSEMTQQLGTDMEMTCPAGQVAKIAQSEGIQQLGTDMEMIFPAGQVDKIAKSEMRQQFGTDMEMISVGQVPKIAQRKVTQQLGTDMEMTCPTGRVAKITQSEMTQQLGTDMEMTLPTGNVAILTQSNGIQKAVKDMNMSSRAGEVVQNDVMQTSIKDSDITCSVEQVGKLSQSNLGNKANVKRELSCQLNQSVNSVQGKHTQKECADLDMIESVNQVRPALRNDCVQRNADKEDSIQTSSQYAQNSCSSVEDIKVSLDTAQRLNDDMEMTRTAGEDVKVSLHTTQGLTDARIAGEGVKVSLDTTQDQKDDMEMTHTAGEDVKVSLDKTQGINVDIEMTHTAGEDVKVSLDKTQGLNDEMEMTHIVGEVSNISKHNVSQNINVSTENICHAGEDILVRSYLMIRKNDADLETSCCSDQTDKIVPCNISKQTKTDTKMTNLTNQDRSAVQHDMTQKTGVEIDRSHLADEILSRSGLTQKHSAVSFDDSRVINSKEKQTYHVSEPYSNKIMDHQVTETLSKGKKIGLMEQPCKDVVVSKIASASSVVNSEVLCRSSLLSHNMSESKKNGDHKHSIKSLITQAPQEPGGAAYEVPELRDAGKDDTMEVSLLVKHSEDELVAERKQVSNLETNYEFCSEQQCDVSAVEQMQVATSGEFMKDSYVQSLNITFNEHAQLNFPSEEKQSAPIESLSNTSKKLTSVNSSVVNVDMNTDKEGKISCSPRRKSIIGLVSEPVFRSFLANRDEPEEDSDKLDISNVVEKEGMGSVDLEVIGDEKSVEESVAANLRADQGMKTSLCSEKLALSPPQLNPVTLNMTSDQPLSRDKSAGTNCKNLLVSSDHNDPFLSSASSETHNLSSEKNDAILSTSFVNENTVVSSISINTSLPSSGINLENDTEEELLDDIDIVFEGSGNISSDSVFQDVSDSKEFNQSHALKACAGNTQRRKSLAAEVVEESLPVISSFMERVSNFYASYSQPDEADVKDTSQAMITSVNSDPLKSNDNICLKSTNDDAGCRQTPVLSENTSSNLDTDVKQSENGIPSQDELLMNKNARAPQSDISSQITSAIPAESHMQHTASVVNTESLDNQNTNALLAESQMNQSATAALTETQFTQIANATQSESEFNQRTSAPLTGSQLNENTNSKQVESQFNQSTSATQAELQSNQNTSATQAELQSNQKTNATQAESKLNQNTNVTQAQPLINQHSSATQVEPQLSQSTNALRFELQVDQSISSLNQNTGATKFEEFHINQSPIAMKRMSEMTESPLNQNTSTGEAVFLTNQTEHNMSANVKLTESLVEERTLVSDGKNPESCMQVSLSGSRSVNVECEIGSAKELKADDLMKEVNSLPTSQVDQESNISKAACVTESDPSYTNNQDVSLMPGQLYDSENGSKSILQTSNETKVIVNISAANLSLLQDLSNISTKMTDEGQNDCASDSSNDRCKELKQLGSGTKRKSEEGENGPPLKKKADALKSMVNIAAAANQPCEGCGVVDGSVISQSGRKWIVAEVAMGVRRLVLQHTKLSIKLNVVQYDSHLTISSATWSPRPSELSNKCGRLGLSVLGCRVESAVTKLSGLALCEAGPALAMVAAAFQDITALLLELQMLSASYITTFLHNSVKVTLFKVSAHVSVDVTVELQPPTPTPSMPYTLHPSASVTIGNMRKKYVEEAMAGVESGPKQLLRIVKAVNFLVQSMAPC